MTTAQDVYSGLPHMRLLLCRNCRRIDEIPDFQGHPDDDVSLEYAVLEHQKHEANLIRLPIVLWMNDGTRTEIIKQLSQGSTGLDLFHQHYYEVRNTFQEDAGVCWKAHSSPKGQCPDFHSDKKALRPDTAQERKDLGLQPAKVGPKVYLCDFCVVKTYNERKARGD